jgi:hypothetical protein
MIDLINYNNNNKQVIVFITDTYTQKLVENETIISWNFASTISSNWFIKFVFLMSLKPKFSLFRFGKISNFLIIISIY